MARTVLVVDDDPLVLEVTAAMLDDLGCDVVTASTGKQALELLFAHQRIEILITDVNMPVMGGHELVERAKRLRKQLQVILLSGRETDDHRYPLIRKPFRECDLVNTMKLTTGLC